MVREIEWLFKYQFIFLLLTERKALSGSQWPSGLIHQIRSRGRGDAQSLRQRFANFILLLKQTTQLQDKVRFGKMTIDVYGQFAECRIR